MASPNSSGSAFLTKGPPHDVAHSVPSPERYRREMADYLSYSETEAMSRAEQERAAAPPPPDTAQRDFDEALAEFRANAAPESSVAVHLATRGVALLLTLGALAADVALFSFIDLDMTVTAVCIVHVLCFALLLCHLNMVLRSDCFVRGRDVSVSAVKWLRVVGIGEIVYSVLAAGTAAWLIVTNASATARTLILCMVGLVRFLGALVLGGIAHYTRPTAQTLRALPSC